VSPPRPAWLPARALVIGLGESGNAAALALAEQGVEVVAADRSPQADAGRLAASDVELHLGREEESLLRGVELVVKSPGVPGESPLAEAARRRALPIWSEVELGFRLLPARTRLVGVTGTKGKTTTTRLLGSMFATAGRPFALGGNEHVPLSKLAGELEPGSWVVAELSSFQLEDVVTLSLDVAVLLNLEPDHLDRHGTFEAYRDAKLRIFERARAKIVPHGSGLPGIEFAEDDPLPAEPRMPGAHNRQNAAAAVAAARAAGIDDDAITHALLSFPGVPHRLELVRELRGVRWINDSKATNTTAARRGIVAYADEPLRLVLGGSTKGESFDELAATLPSTVRSIHLIGETAGDIADALDRAGRSYERDGDLATAVRAAAALAEPGDVVLLSPACASYDQFRNFEERGDTFRRLVEELE
jgi:UDP-N-acetylmuramoylalanine--D-glutamate ligase